MHQRQKAQCNSTQCRNQQYALGAADLPKPHSSFAGDCYRLLRDVGLCDGSLCNVSTASTWGKWRRLPSILRGVDEKGVSMCTSLTAHLTPGRGEKPVRGGDVGAVMGTVVAENSDGASPSVSAAIGNVSLISTRGSTSTLVGPMLLMTDASRDATRTPSGTATAGALRRDLICAAGAGTSIDMRLLWVRAAPNGRLRWENCCCDRQLDHSVTSNQKILGCPRQLHCAEVGGIAINPLRVLTLPHTLTGALAVLVLRPHRCRRTAASGASLA